MKTSHRIAAAGPKGFTLIELTVIILVLLLFLGMSFLGVSAWKRGADRANCVLNIRHLQMAVRGYSNTHNLYPGMNTALASPPVNLNAELIGEGKYVAGEPSCPGDGDYTLGGSMVPELGSLYMTCSLEDSEGHVPSEFGSW